jgi:salicylate hydroxylase
MPSPRPLRVAVIGAGLGGLTAAIALRHFGCEVTVLEQAPQLGEVGAGVQLSPNAVKVLRALGLEQRALDLCFEPARHVIRSWRSGREVSATPLRGALTDAYGAGYFGFHRADLHAILADAVPPGTVRLGMRCVRVVNDENIARVTLEDQSTLDFDVVLGADGIHSVVRESLFGPESPRFTGHVCWRGLVPASALGDTPVAPDMTVWFGPKAHIVHYYVRRGELVNWIATYEADDWKSESWRVQGRREEVMERFAGWHPTLRALLAKSEVYYKWALFDRDPLPQWTQGRVALLGDAVHPMLPYLAQGACMAIEDGYAVAAALARQPQDVPAALREYQEQRRDRTARVQLLARARGIENNLSSPFACFMRDVRYAWKRWTQPTRHTYGIDWIYGHDVTRQAAP